MRLIFTVFIFIMSIQLNAQTENIHTSFPLSLGDNQRLMQSTQFSFTAIALKSKEIDDFSKIGFIYKEDTVNFNNDLHSNKNSDYFYSSLIHFNQTLKSVELYIPENINDLEVILINGSGEYSNFSERRLESFAENECVLPEIFQQSEWRTGLPEPSYERIYTITENIIIHHSAGSNNITDFTQAVRDIYIFHTQENGWSDIGYNYLVAPDGVVYAGRDPEDGNQDEVMGAHFCSSNSNTMGVCLLGNYDTVEPTTSMLESLESVITCKAYKDSLNVLGKDFHSLNPNLDVIAGHRDGCGTLCPGKNIYNLLPQIRVNVDEQLAVYYSEDDEGSDGDEEVISPPAAITTSNVTSLSFDLSWDVVSSAAQYQIYVGLNSDTSSLEENDSLIVVSNENLKYQVPEYSELYYYFVRAISSDGDTSNFSTLNSIKLPVSAYLEQDSLAMLALYKNTNGEDWENAQNWTTGKLNTWKGLTMVKDSLKAIDLPTNEIEGVIPSELSGLNFVNLINFSSNNLTDISALVSLNEDINELNVSGNQLSFEELLPFNVIPTFIYDNQDVKYSLLEEYFDFLDTDFTMASSATASSNTFQWYKGSVPISGETDSVLVFDNLQRADEGSYHVEVRNNLLVDLMISSTVTEVKVSSLERDAEALRQLYESTDGAEWSTITWDTSSDNPIDWSENEQDIIVEGNSVVEINLPDNNLTGSVPQIMDEMLGLRTIDLSNNAIEDIPDLSTLPYLSLFDVSGNALGYGALETNLVVDKFIFKHQANFGELADQRLPQGSGFSIEYTVYGSNNIYQWYRNNEELNTSNSSSISDDSLTFEQMGEYKLVVRNELINAIDPEFTLESNPVGIIATASVSGSVADVNDSPTESGQIYLFEYSEGQAFDSVLLDNSEFFETVETDGTFEMQNLTMGDYVLYVDNNESNYPSLLNTYFPTGIDWEVAEVISLRSNLQDMEVTMVGKPQALNGTSNFSGYLEQEFEENSRVLQRRRVKKAGVSVRALDGSSRDVDLKKNLQNGELVAYMETGEYGEFSFPNLPAGRYSVKFDVPGVPMDEESDIIFELTGEDQESLEVSALFDNGKITVNRVSYTANKSELLSNVKVYPNPSSGSFRISVTESILNIKVLSPEGSLIRELSGFANQSQEVEVNLSNYPDGMYFMQIEWKDGMRSINKLIKE